ncbi:tripartite tricarboxylate transporter TctB family protein [Pseudomonas sp. AA-38]|uniref:tripartite tricarboxylate transporter TctB family protein n=1 Tax=Pseudomonas sp. AA-38 TaxID=3028807 RepID=UPI0023F698F1|nr:tripartite tricarboxylate transporter TctB family protein [Pseudomonas sp. AA-38]
MSAKLSGGASAKPCRFGQQSLATLVILLLALAGLLALQSQVLVFDFGDSGPDARFFPRLILALLVLVTGLRLWLRRADLEEAPGAVLDWGRVLLIGLLIAVAVLLMDALGFLLCATAVGVLLAWVLGERRLLFGLLLPLAVAVLVAFGARYALNIPLP